MVSLRDCLTLFKQLVFKGSLSRTLKISFIALELTNQGQYSKATSH